MLHIFAAPSHFSTPDSDNGEAVRAPQFHNSQPNAVISIAICIIYSICCCLCVRIAAQMLRIFAAPSRLSALDHDNGEAVGAPHFRNSQPNAVI